MRYGKIRRCAVSDVFLVQLLSEQADKVSFPIDIYNIQKTNDQVNFREVFEGDLGRKFAFSGAEHQVLASVISFGVDFQITHFSENYLLTANY